MQYIKNTGRKIAYFSMEIGVRQDIRTYSGGLGILAGDTIRSAADLEIPMIAVTLLYRKGYLHQKLNSDGWQGENPDEWRVEDKLKELPNRISLRIEGRYVYIRAWEHEVTGVGGFKVPVLFLDADLPENKEADRRLTHHLYGGDEYYRLCQEKILGIGGLRMLRNLGFTEIERYHMNEGHAALLTLELLDLEATRQGRESVHKDDVHSVQNKCVFTTHTPVPAGHDKFSLDLASKVLQRPEISQMQDVFCYEGMLNLTYLAMNMSRYINGVAKKHGEVSREMFTQHTIDSITNGVHLSTWASPEIQKLFDKRIPDWKKDNFELRYALNIPRAELRKAHRGAKELLINQIKKQTGISMNADCIMIGSARRATPYKRGDLFFQDLKRLELLAKNSQGIQAVFAGKAHPRDEGGKKIIQRIHQMSKNLDGKVSVVFLEDYDMDLARMIVSGVDLWLNTPEPPLEASGTSGMKAALNGVPSLSVLDGWWIEGHVEGITGWAIGEGADGKPQEPDTQRDAASLYGKLENEVLPLYYGNYEGYLHIMRNSIALNGSFFNTQRMLQEYVLKAYYL